MLLRSMGYPIMLGAAAALTGCSAASSTTSSSPHLHEEAELATSYSAGLATGNLNDTQFAEHRWPVEVLSIGHTNASYQYYGGDPYFHHGLDIRADEGSSVIASAGGRVVNIENYEPGNPAYWEVAILDDQGFVWQYHHVDRQSIPDSIFAALRSGERIEDGTKIGEVYSWSVETFGEMYHHIHLNILGEGKAYLSPFQFLDALPDHAAPQFVDVGLLKNGNKFSGSKISGNYTVYATIHDLVLHNKFFVPPHLVTYQVDDRPTATVWDFSNLPGGASREDFVENFFVPSLTCGNYNCRKLTVDLGFTKNGQRYFPSNSGFHRVEITAKDYAGNETKQTFTWEVE